MRKSAEFHRIHAEGRSHQLRRRVALEAARLISEHGMRDYRQAKLKAAQRPIYQLPDLDTDDIGRLYALAGELAAQGAA